MNPNIPSKNGDLRGKVPSRQDFCSLGLEDLAYVKTVMIEGQPLYAIHAADGTPLTVIKGRDVAFAAIRQHDMEPMSVH